MVRTSILAEKPHRRFGSARRLVLAGLLCLAAPRGTEASVAGGATAGLNASSGGGDAAALQPLPLPLAAAAAAAAVSPSPQRPFMDYVLIYSPVLGLLYLCFYACKMYYRFCTGGPAGKVKLPLEDAADAGANVRVFFDMKIGDQDAGRIEFLLFAQHYPRTSENFRACCTGEIVGRHGKKLHYKGSKFHRIIPGFICQGGDCTGGQSIYGSSFKDEWASGYIEHSREGLLSMANAGRDTQTSQFFITLDRCHHLDGRHVVFGQVTDGMEVVRRMGEVGRSKAKAVVITDCGEVSKGRPATVQRKDAKEV